MSASPDIMQEDACQQALLAIYLPAMRQRFKAEINRQTSGGLAQMLGQREDGAELSFLLTYLYGWHWLRHNVGDDYREPVLAAFKQPERLFLMRLLAYAETAKDFVEGYIRHWQQAPNGGLQRNTNCWSRC